MGIRNKIICGAVILVFVLASILSVDQFQFDQRKVNIVNGENIGEKNAAVSTDAEGTGDESASLSLIHI